MLIFWLILSLVNVLSWESDELKNGVISLVYILASSYQMNSSTHKCQNHGHKWTTWQRFHPNLGFASTVVDNSN